MQERLTHDVRRILRFKQEARAASALNHPCLLHIYEAGVEAGRHYLVTEYVEGSTLREKLNKQSISEAAAIKIAFQLASAMGAAHQAGIVHRDIKPENMPGLNVRVGSI